MKNKSTQLCIRLDKGLKDRLEREAEAQDRSVASYIRMLFVKHLGRGK